MRQGMVKNNPYYNQTINRKELKFLIGDVFRNHGITSAAKMADSLKDLGFKYATQAGFSLSLEDLKIPPRKKQLLQSTYESIQAAEKKYLRGEITTVERFQKVIDTWNNASETLKDEVISYFKNTDPLNAVYIMAFSGARGSISQVRQLVGMRGLMSDPAGQIIDIPIASNFREGLNVTEYFISSYGARKGLVDTALRTADSGYLTRRLVDVAQDVIIQETNCKTKRGIPLYISTSQQLIGRVLVDNIYHPRTGALIAIANQDINYELAEEIRDAKINKILVRSTLTCESNNSICQFCYGWSLAHDRLVDLGEAVGIIAAQSIGEPGTQLTMRTFHTGGVFTGEIAKQISSSSNSKVLFNNFVKMNPTRTRHGDQANILLESLIIKLIDENNIFQKEINLPEGSILFVQNEQFLTKGEVIAELPIGNRLGKEKAYKQISTDIEGQVYFTNLIIEETQNKQQIKRTSKDGGLIWILSGKVYDIPSNASIVVQEKDKLIKGDTLAEIKITNKYPGEVFFPQENKKINVTTEIYIITQSLLFKETRVYVDRLGGQKAYILETSTEQKFILHNLFESKLSHYQILGDLVTDTYKTQTGGMIKYLDLPVERCLLSDKESFEVMGGGYILWVEEETHEINKDISLLLVNHGEKVEAGTEIIKNIFCKNSGMIDIIQKDDIVREIVIKPGKLISVPEDIFFKKKRRGFLRPGEKLIDIFEADNIIYWEWLQIEDQSYVLIRSVTVYSVPDTLSSLEKEFMQTSSNQLGISIIRNICFKDGEKVKSVDGVELIKTQMVANIPTFDLCLAAKVELQPANESYTSFHFQLIMFETLNVDNKNQRNISNQITHLLVKNKQMVPAESVIAQTEIITTEEGEVSVIETADTTNIRLLNLTKQDYSIFQLEKADTYLQKGQWIRVGDEITPNFISNHSGQILEIHEDQVILRLARPYLLSPNTVLYVNNKDLLHKGDILAGLTYETFKTGDIVQGLPRIEEILEVRKKTEGPTNPHNLLESKFTKYIHGKLELKNAVRLSTQEIQLFLVEAIQSVYKSQGVEIADKHIEIIVRQMSSKVKIKTGGDTGYLPGDLIEIQKIEKQNQTMTSLTKEPATYTPLLLGITKASLNTESFISAASFQETTKILTEAAISGKLDWLKGLKENVIIGRLIPAGTGFGSYHNQFNSSRIHKKDSIYLSSNYSDKNSLKSNLDDIILDDRSFRNYPFSHE
uniref:DNA-directed RNA polymerase n=1 Tax=Bangiopsis subsimplex TaxID=139980 RepID=A0A1C9CCT5_9RHOD|nr:RNA polymerase beta'' subunit [Bangiopsis subsimplex]AOM66196.1 RNA polymerase beta'' subunit [Bangiopsis subsimplex]ARO90443.1 plastid-encoded DNA-directed RNA polymerase [Bangiopsis subsimplex]